MDQPSPLSLSRAYPGLAGRLPRVALADLPTPVERPAALGAALGLPGLHLKRDDLSGLQYGSNKVRKLEFLLGEALCKGAKNVFTLGFAGSNHALATAIFARGLGLGCTSLLMPQPPAAYVRRNLLAGQGAGARLQACGSLLSLGLHYLRLRQRAYPIPAGGTCPLGVAAYVSAAFELREQIQAGELPEPDCIYVPFGSMGTAAGLSLGLQAAGLRTRIEAVRVIERRWAAPADLRRLLRKSLAFLRDLDPAFPELAEPGSNLRIRDEFLGAGYGRCTEAGEAATALVASTTSIELNGTYSAKAFAALMADARQDRLRGQTVLYWNTYNNRDLGPLLEGVDPRELPQAFQRYLRA